MSNAVDLERLCSDITEGKFDYEGLLQIKPILRTITAIINNKLQGKYE